MKKLKFFTYLSLLTMTLGYLVLRGIQSIVYRFQNPDMTQLRFLLEHPTIIIESIVGATLVFIFWMLMCKSLEE